MKVYNKSNLTVERATKQACPRCKGTGSVFPTDHGDDCFLCEGKGEVWMSESSGYCRAMYKPLDQSVLY